MSHSFEATRYVVDLSAGRSKSAEDLLPLVYNQLREIAANYIKRERGDHVLQPTALVHEAYVRLVDDTQVDWRGRTHFMAIAAKAMQRVLIDHARSRDRVKRGGPGVHGGNDEPDSSGDSPSAMCRDAESAQSDEKVWRKVALTDAFALTEHNRLDVLALEDALKTMREVDPRQAQVATLRLFSEMGDDQIAELLDVSQRTVERDWKMAKAWLRRELSDESTTR